MKTEAAASRAPLSPDALLAGPTADRSDRTAGSNRVPEAIAPVLLTTRQTAEMLSLSARQVARYIDRGELRALHLGRAVRVPIAEVNSFVARQMLAQHPDYTSPSSRDEVAA
jgi:excisionase family DNA binding protein